ncbi:MAG TPA: MMPL family transporter [Nevskiales bacterium]|nr:MMPL family transporter [Nevskiales bacterium]
MHGDARGAFSQLFIRLTEPIVFGRRGRTLLVLLLGTLFFGYHASQLKVDAGFEKMLPLEHPYMKTFLKYQEAFGGANTVLVAVINKEKGTDIYNEQFLTTLKKVTDEVFFLPGIDRARVQSLFTPNTRYIEVVEGGFSGGNVIPADYAPSPEMFQLVKTNVAKAGIIGRFVTNDQRGAMVFSELLERDPVTGKKLDYWAVSKNLESKIRQRFTQQEIYEYKLTKDVVDPATNQVLIKAGEVVLRDAAAPSRWLRWQTLIADQKTPDGGLIEVKGEDVEVATVPNPDYNPNVDIHIIGFAKVVGDIADAIVEVVGFFGLTLLLTLILLWQYCGSLKIALIPLSCSVLAVVWELGMLRLFGYGLDPFAILVPFLVLAIGVSHGIQITSFWLYEVADHGLESFEASRATYRRLVIPGISAVLTNVVGFGTILLIPIAIVQEMAINAMFGLIAIIICKKVLLPCLLSYASLKDPVKFREHQHARDRLFDSAWKMLSAITKKPIAAAVLIFAAMLFGWGFWMWGQLAIGDLHAGVPELRPDSRYNKDTDSIQANFAIGTDILKVIVETVPESCIKYDVMENIDRFAWRMENTAGVTSVVSLPQVAKIVNSGWNEGSLKWRILPRNQYVIVQAIQPIDTSYGLFNANCSALPVILFTRDHKAETITHIVAEVNRYNAENSNPEGWRPPEDPAEAAKWAAPEPGTPEFEKGPYIDFKLATGNVGVMAASNDVIRDTEHTVLFWVFLGIGVCVFLSFRTLAGLVCVLVPLGVVSMLSYAVMVFLDIGLKVATLPVAAFAAGIGVDYGIYIYSVLEECVEKGMELREAYEQTLHQTGKAVIFTALTLGASVSTWMLSGLQFQVDMGILLTIMFIANAVAAVLMLPAFAAFLLEKLPAAEPAKA